MLRRILARVVIATGILVTCGFMFLIGDRWWVVQVALSLLYFCCQLGLYWLWRWITSRTICPQCSNPRAMLNYDANGDEQLKCEVCGLQQATGACLPND